MKVMMENKKSVYITVCCIYGLSRIFFFIIEEKKKEKGERKGS